MIEGLVVGRVVHFRMPGGRQGQGAGQCRPATIVKVFRDGSGAPASTNGCVNLVVLQDGSNDRGATSSPEGPLSTWQTSIVKADDQADMNKWHWPQECMTDDLASVTKAPAGAPPATAPAS